jgi:hypothetical protein
VTEATSKILAQSEAAVPLRVDLRKQPALPGGATHAH